VKDRLGELAGRWGLSGAATEALAAALRLLGEDPAAPTSVREPGEAVDAHVADSLVALELPAVTAAGQVADLGAGAGFPGVALAAALPDARVVLVESVGRKCQFLARLVEASGLGNVEVVCARAESWVEGLGRQDLVTARALAPLPVVLEYAAPLLREGGAVVAWRGRREAGQEAAASAAASELGLELVEVRRVEPFPAARDRHLHVYRKVAPTPPRFPRRPGMAAKRPLGT
jgi:16S rRNA (guanine527-N7)-methyltransferase